MDCGKWNSESGKRGHGVGVNGGFSGGGKVGVWFYCFAWFGRSYNGVRVLLSATVDFTFFCLPGLPVTGC